MIVMNGQRIIQALVNNEWETTGTIKKAEEGIKPGIYNIYLAKTPEERYETAQSLARDVAFATRGQWHLRSTNA